MNVIFMIKPLQFKRWWHETSLLMADGGSTFYCNRPLKHDWKQISLKCVLEYEFFFFLKLHLIKVQWSAAVQTSNCLTSNPDGLWRFFIGSFTIWGFWTRLLRDGVRLRWPDASETEVRSFKYVATHRPSVKAACVILPASPSVPCRGLETFSPTCGADLPNKDTCFLCFWLPWMCWGEQRF